MSILFISNEVDRLSLTDTMLQQCILFYFTMFTWQFSNGYKQDHAVLQTSLSLARCSSAPTSKPCRHAIMGLWMSYCLYAQHVILGLMLL